MNSIFLKIAVFFVWLVDRGKADRNASWDNAMNFMEKLEPSPAGLLDLKIKFEFLASRAEERADIEVENSSFTMVNSEAWQ